MGEVAFSKDSLTVACTAVRRFYAELRREVAEVAGSHLTGRERQDLRGHYGVMMAPERYPPELAAHIYTTRRAPPAAAIMGAQSPLVFDAGCAFGSESFLFASLGARVIAADRSPEQIGIALKRKAYYEELWKRELDIEFHQADLEDYSPPPGLTLTWMASVLAAIRDQEGLMSRIFQATRPEGEVMITDMNLLNPLFLRNEWRRRRRGRDRCREFGVHAHFLNMVRRKGREGARFCQDPGGGSFDDVQFFTPGTLAGLMQKSGFKVIGMSFSGFVPPLLHRAGLGVLERVLPHVPLVRKAGYFYLVTGRKEAGR